MKHSQLGLIQNEMRIATERQTFFSRVKNESRMKKNVQLIIGTPLLLFLRMKNLVSILPDNNYDFEIDDAYLMAGMDIVNQYGERVSASQMHKGLIETEGTAVQHFREGVNYVGNEHDLTPVKVSLPYRLVLSLEWIVDDLARFVQRRTEDLMKGDHGDEVPTLRIFTVEDMLRIQFTKITIDARDGKHPDLAKKMRYFVKNGANITA